MAAAVEAKLNELRQIVVADFAALEQEIARLKAENAALKQRLGDDAVAEPAVVVHAEEAPAADKGKKAKKEKGSKKEAEKGSKKEAEKGSKKEAEKGSKKEAEKGSKNEKAVKAKEEKKAAPKEAKKKEDPKDALIKACIKEGGKKGQDICGMSSFGVSFFATAIESANGELEMLAHVMEGMNREVDEKEEDRKGGAGDLGKCLLSASDTNLAVMCHVPKEVVEKCTAAEWFEAMCGPLNPEIVSQTENMICANIPANPEAGKFALKMRDEAIGYGFAFLRTKGLVPDDDEDDENYAEAAGVDLNAGPPPAAATAEEDY